MRVAALLLGLLAASSGCKSVDCGQGTIEKAGECQPANVTTTAATCGPFTMLQGNTCVPMFPPTVCDPATTLGQLDPSTGVTTCLGTGAGGCSAPIPCPAPASGKQTVCGQIYDLETGAPFAAAGATGAACGSGATDGPCALQIQAYDAVAFATSPSTTPPLSTGTVTIDDCGRYRVSDISPPSSPLLGIGIDDANPANMGPAGVTNAVGLALTSQSGAATAGFEAFVVKPSTTTAWASSGGPPLSGGIFVGLFRAKSGDPNTNGDTCTGTGCDAPQSGVTFTNNGATEPADDYYFTAAEANLTTVDPTATATGSNGAGLLTNASVTDSLVYAGTGGLSDTTNCQWKNHGAASLPNIVTIQIFRPTSKPLKTCSL